MLCYLARMSTPEQTIDPVLYEPPTVTIAGTTYKIRRLNLADTFRVARIVGSGVGAMTRMGDKVDAAAVTQVLVASLTHNSTAVLEFLATIIDVPIDAFEDPDLFPMESIITLVEAMAKHQDLLGFFTKLQGVISALPEAQVASKQAAKRTTKAKA